MPININNRLEEIILKHHIDRFHPCFKKRMQAIAYLTEYFMKIGEDSLLLVASCETDKEYMAEDFSLSNCLVLDYEFPDAQVVEQLRKEEKQIVVVSYYKRRELISCLEANGIKASSMYDELAVRGVILEGNYYDIFGEQYSDYLSRQDTFDYGKLDINSVFFYDRRCYEIAETPLIAEMYLTRMIFDCVYSKNFVLAQKYIQEYADRNFTNAVGMQQSWTEIQQLLNMIKEKLAERQTKDIVMFWLDQLEYGEDQDMPFLRSMSEKSMDFENAYTVTPYTNPTARTLFSGKYAVDDRSYNDTINTQSSFIRRIENRGYSFKFYTCLKKVDSSIKGSVVQNEYAPISQICWDMVTDMLEHDGPICAVIHEVFQTHSPYISFGLSGNQYSYKEIPGQKLELAESNLRKKQKKESRKYVDDVLKLYDDLLPQEIFKIYMSDHGLTAYGRWHTIFRIVQKEILPVKIKKVFSYVDFEKLIFNILEEDASLDSVVRSYAYIQDVDYYEKQYLKAVLSAENINLADVFGYKGVVTEREQYIRYNDGRTVYINRDSSGKRVTQEREEYLASLVTEYPKDLIREEKFKYTRNAYRTRENYYRRNGQREVKKRAIVKGLFNAIPAHRGVAVRGGGQHTIGMWAALDWPQRNKIAYIIDYNKECIASRLGVEVIGPDEIIEKKIDAIILSSLDYEDIWYQELKEQVKDVEIIKIYGSLKEQGIICNGSFYWEDICAEDAVWEE